MRVYGWCVCVCVGVCGVCVCVCVDVWVGVWMCVCVVVRLRIRGWGAGGGIENYDDASAAMLVKPQDDHPANNPSRTDFHRVHLICVDFVASCRGGRPPVLGMVARQLFGGLTSIFWGSQSQGLASRLQGLKRDIAALRCPADGSDVALEASKHEHNQHDFH